jgi:hypothetical protein
MSQCCATCEQRVDQALGQRCSSPLASAFERRVAADFWCVEYQADRAELARQADEKSAFH